MEARAHDLSPADRERLRLAVGAEVVDLGHSLFGPDSVTWRVNREAVLLLGGGRALLLQVAHPLVAAGVAAHSDFTHDPLMRLRRTLELTLTITFADAARALRAVRAIERIHAGVHGVLAAAVGPYPRGTSYDANDPELLFWVHATLVDTALLVYQRFVAPLAPRHPARYYEESKIAARLMGVPDRLIPARYADFRRYMQEMILGPRLAVGPDSRAIAASVLRPPLPWVTQPVFWLSEAVTITLLPPVLRQRYGFATRTAHATLTRSLASIARPTLSILPRMVRLLPHARRAGA
jgi:uncharacterized protein (DUF2236 family)